MQQNAAYAVGLGVPLVQPMNTRLPLAVVGGGPSVVSHLDELRAWPGEIWAINETCRWLKSNGIDSTFFSVDPLEVIAGWIDGGPALLASSCHPKCWSKADARMFHMENVTADNPVIGGTTTALRAPMLALRMGYAPVSFFGCESSYADTSHAYRSEQPIDQVIVRADGVDYRTDLALLDQAENLAVIFREFPDVFIDRSGGLAAAMAKDPDWEVVALSGHLKEQLDP